MLIYPVGKSAFQAKFFGSPKVILLAKYCLTAEKERRDELIMELAVTCQEPPSMSLKPQELYIVPPETARVALAVFPKGNLCITISDTLGTALSDKAFSELFQLKG